MPTLKHLPADTPAEAISALLDAEGALILDDVLTGAQADRVQAEIDPYVAATADGRDRFTGFQTTRTGALVARSPACRELIMHPAILAACDVFLKRACDRLAWGGFLQGVEPQLNTIWAMTDFTQANGATQVVPGSPAWPESRRAEPQEVGYAEMKRGSVLVYSGSVIHGGGENRSGADRVGINLTYCLGWLRQEENQYLSCPPAVARKLDPKLQALLGYAMGSYALGYFSPPLPPGAGPEVVPPQFALGEAVDPGWGEDLLADINERVRAKLKA